MTEVKKEVIQVREYLTNKMIFYSIFQIHLNTT